jgi:hypothetical protein
LGLLGQLVQVIAPERLLHIGDIPLNVGPVLVAGWDYAAKLVKTEFKTLMVFGSHGFGSLISHGR